MPYNLLIFPLVGGYYFLVTSLRFKYIHQRLDRQRLIFNSAIAGLVFLFLSFLIVTTAHKFIPQTLIELRSQVPITLDYLGTSLVSLIIAILAGHVSNYRFDRVEYLTSLIRRKGDGMESLLLDALENRNSISITLNNRKVYVGFVATVEEPGENYIKLIPLFSGYRDTNTHEVTFTTNYVDLYIEEEEGEFEQLPETYFELTIKKDEILIANRFDPKVYERINSPSDEE